MDTVVHLPSLEMGSIREFLESSTIHGLQYISTTQKSVKVLWFFIVVAGFTGAGVLINQSFQSWNESPITYLAAKS